MAKRSNFKLSPISTWLVVGAGMALTGVLACCPEVIPYPSLGPVGTFLHYIAYDHPLLIRGTFFGAAIIHFVEGIVAFVMCRRMKLSTRDTLLWTLQTVGVGFGSLLPLRALYKKNKTKSQ
ncbi:transmembrane protein 254-like [Halichondria panicea]|uniref:transmembrane protein 254-like n=1 Tax=Halichondria panicea TaxID=6063 RepID=UPI00312B6AAF